VPKGSPSPFPKKPMSQWVRIPQAGPGPAAEAGAGRARKCLKSGAMSGRLDSNGLERHGARSRPKTPPLASLTGIHAFTGVLRHGFLGTISATTETEYARQYQGGLWLGNQDSNHSMHFICIAFNRAKNVREIASRTKSGDQPEISGELAGCYSLQAYWARLKRVSRSSSNISPVSSKTADCPVSAS
jgi:hypothetical protein